jgi:hypothetical protein
MSSSSGSEPTPQLDVDEIEQAEEIVEQHPGRVEGAFGEGEARAQGGGWITALWALPGFAWLGFYLIAPLVFIVLVSFWTYEVGVTSGFVTDWTLSNYRELFSDNVYWDNMRSSFVRSLIAVAACLIFGFPVAYFLALKVNSLRNQIALFILALAPFWTSYLTRSVAWTYPLMGREGALNQVLVKLGIPGAPFDQLGFSGLSVTLAMIQLYILFMVTPLFFTLSQVDRTRPGRELVPHVPGGDPAADDARHRDRLDLHLRAHDGRVRDGARDRRQCGLVRRDDRPIQGRAGRAVPARSSVRRTARARARGRRLRHHTLLEPARGHLT